MNTCLASDLHFPSSSSPRQTPTGMPQACARIFRSSTPSAAIAGLEPRRIGCIVALLCLKGRAGGGEMGEAPPPTLEVEQDRTSLTENGGGRYFFRKEGSLHLTSRGSVRIKAIPALADRVPEAGKRLWSLVIGRGWMGRRGAASDGRQSARDKGERHGEILAACFPPSFEPQRYPPTFSIDFIRNNDLRPKIPRNVWQKPYFG